MHDIPPDYSLLTDGDREAIDRARLARDLHHQRRERAARSALIGLLAAGADDEHYEAQVAEKAVLLGDALLDRLDRTAHHETSVAPARPR